MWCTLCCPGTTAISHLVLNINLHLESPASPVASFACKPDTSALSEYDLGPQHRGTHNQNCTDRRLQSRCCPFKVQRMTSTDLRFNKQKNSIAKGLPRNIYMLIQQVMDDSPACMPPLCVKHQRESTTAAPYQAIMMHHLPHQCRQHRNLAQSVRLQNLLTHSMPLGNLWAWKPSHSQLHISELCTHAQLLLSLM